MYVYIHIYVIILQTHVLIYKHDSTLCSHPSSAPPPPNSLECFKDIESGDFSKSCKQNAYWCAICVPLLQILRSKHNLENVSAILQRFFCKTAYVGEKKLQIRSDYHYCNIFSLLQVFMAENSSILKVQEKKGKRSPIIIIGYNFTDHCAGRNSKSGRPFPL